MGGMRLSLAAVVLVGGCVVDLGEEAPLARRAGEVVGDCVVPVPAAFAGLGAPVSVELAGASLWLWGETQLAAPGPGGETILPNAAAVVRSVEGACGGDLELVVDAAGAPAPFIPLTAEEDEANRTRTDGRRVVLEARGGFGMMGRAYVYYAKLLRGPGLFDEELLGVGLCTADAPGATSVCERATPAIDPDEPTLMWIGAERSWGATGFVYADGDAYLS